MAVKLIFSAILVIVMSLTTSGFAKAQQAQANICQTDERFNQFDFWLGSWDVYNNANGQIVGHNLITPTDNKCFLYENWTSINGGTGHSMNYYNPVTGLWRQVWVAAGAYNIDYTGGLTGDSMVLQGQIYYYEPKAEFPFRGTWTPNEDGSVRQFFEQYNPETESWNVWFDGKYIRSKAN